MTKVQKINDNLLQFINEDTGAAEIFQGDLALKKFNDISTKATDKSIQDKKSQSYTIGLFWDLVNGHVLENKSFEDFLLDVDPTTLKIETGRKIFNKAKYDKKIKEHKSQMKSLIDRYNNIISNRDLDLGTQENAAREIMSEFNDLKKVIINPSEKEFHEIEFEDVQVSADEAFEIVKDIKSNYDLKCSTDIENKRIIEIELDRDRFKDISEDDFQFIKRLNRLIDSNSFFNMFEHNPVYRYNALSFDTLEDYFNRDRDLKSDVELVLTSSELSAVRFISEIYKVYCKQMINDKLRKDLNDMVSALKEK